MKTKHLELEKKLAALKKTEIRLQKENATKSKFFSILAHDMKNPFNAILGFSEVLSQSTYNLSKEQYRKYNLIIHNTAKSLYALIENLLEWSRMQLDGIKSSPEYFDIYRLAVNNLVLFEVSAYRKKIEMICTVEKNTIVFADKTLIDTVIRNLIDNAIKFTGKNGKVIISSKVLNDMIEISIQDTGIGISSDKIPQLFNLESTLSTKGTAEEKGTGLGLLICKEFVELNQGSIQVKSTLGSGTTFSFTIPANKALGL